MAVDVDNLSVHGINDNITTTVAHNVEHVTTTFNRNLRNCNADRAVVVISNLSLQVSRYVSRNEVPGQGTHRIGIDLGGYDFRTLRRR